MNTIIEDNLYIYKNKYFTYDVQLNLYCLTYTPHSNKAKKNVTVKELVKDIIGCSLMKSNNSEIKNSAFITIYSYPIQGKSKRIRKRRVITFEVCYKNSFQENLEVANKWRSSLYYAMYFCNEYEKPSPLFKTQKKFLIFINPKSGPGIALEIFEKKVKPVLAEAEIEFDNLVTDHAQHAYEFIQHKDLSPYSGIIVIAGDGLIYEIYNGLLQRNDSDTALSIPIGVIPGGSGNGLASSISHLIREPYLFNPVLVNTLNIANPVVTPLDLVLLETHKKRKLISFLSIGFGILADIDIESERLRALGEARFTLYALTRIFNLRKYRVKLSYKPSADALKSTSVSNLRPALSRSRTVPDGVPSRDGRAALPPRPRSMTFEKAEGGVPLPPVELVSEADLEEVSVEEGHGPACQRSSWKSAVRLDQKFETGLDDPLPEDWVTLEDDFILIYAVNQPYIGSEAFFSPRSLLGDGLLWLCYLRGDVSKATLFKFLVAMETGTHVDLPGVTYVPVTQMRLEPRCSSGKLTVDGELIELGPLTASVLPGKGRVMVRRP